MIDQVPIKTDSLSGVLVRENKSKLILYDINFKQNKTTYYLSVDSVNEELSTFVCDWQKVNPEDFRKADKSLVVAVGKVFFAQGQAFKIIDNPFESISIKFWRDEVIYRSNPDATYLFEKGRFSYFVSIKGNEHFVLKIGALRFEMVNLYNELIRKHLATEVHPDDLTYLEHYTQ